MYVVIKLPFEKVFLYILLQFCEILVTKSETSMKTSNLSNINKNREFVKKCRFILCQDYTLKPLILQ